MELTVAKENNQGKNEYEIQNSVKHAFHQLFKDSEQYYYKEKERNEGVK